MANFLEAFNQAIHSIKENFPLLLLLLAVLWLIHIINFVLRYRLNILGIIPRQPQGVPGIILSPLLHGNFAHLVMNSMMFFILSAMMLVWGRQTYFESSICIILLSGLFTWLFARPGIHIGASGLIMGYFGYLLVNSISHPSSMSIVIAIVCIYYFGGMFMNLFPKEKGVSWEGHVCGFVAGVITSFLI